GLPFTRVAAVLQHTVPGVPLVYTGDEVGLEYEPYEDPGVLKWNDRLRLRPLYQRLAQLREEHPALHSGSFELLPVNSPMQLSFFRKTDDKNWVLVILNFDNSANHSELQLPQSIVDQISGRPVRDL